jgi:AraC-like DNA-binding protein
MINNRATIYTTYSKVIARELNLSEDALAPLLKDTGLKPREFTDPDTLLTPFQQLKIIENAVKIYGDRGLGLQIGHKITPFSHGPLGLLAYSSPTLMDAIDAFCNYLPTRIILTHLATIKTEKYLECHLILDIDTNEDIYRFFIEAFSITLVSIINFVLGYTPAELKIEYKFSQPYYSEIYSNYIDFNYSFSKPKSVLFIPIELCEKRNANADQDNYRIALEQCKKRLKQLGGNTSLINQIESILFSHGSIHSTEEEIASLLLMNKRTLARKLAEENSSFRELRDNVLATMACEYLNQTQLSVEAIAQIMGYHDSASFRRAFKRWKNLTPSQFREQN